MRELFLKRDGLLWMMFLRRYKAIHAAVKKTVTGALLHVVDALAKPAKKFVATLEPIQSGSGDPSPDNIRPITGHTGANVVMTGKNLLDMSDTNIEVGKYIDNSGAQKSSGSNFYNSVYIPVKASETYTLSTSSFIRYCSFMEYDANKTFVKRTLYGGGSATITSQSHTMGDTTAFVLIGSNPTGNTIGITGIKAINWMFYEGSTATSYEPYQATTITITFPSEAGIVYGGTLDVTTGVLTVKWATAKVMSFTRTNNYNFYRNTSSFEHRPLSKLYYTTQLLCDRRLPITNPGTSTPADGCYVDGNRAIVVRTSEPYATAAEMVTAMGGELNFCYRIDPYTIQLDPVTISMLLGENNIWVDDSDDLELTYLAKAGTTP